MRGPTSPLARAYFCSPDGSFPRFGSVGHGLDTSVNLSGSYVRSPSATVDRFARFPARRATQSRPSSPRSTIASSSRTLRPVQWAEGASGQPHRSPRLPARMNRCACHCLRKNARAFLFQLGLQGYVSELDTRCRSARAASAPSPNQTSPTNSAEEAFFPTTHDVSRTCIDVVDRVGAGYIQQSRKYPR